MIKSKTKESLPTSRENLHRFEIQFVGIKFENCNADRLRENLEVMTGVAVSVVARLFACE